MTVVLLLYGNWCGLGLTYDSYNYLAAAESLTASGELRMNDGNPYVVHAPLYPAIISFFGEDPERYLRFLHLVLYMSTMLIIMRIIKISIGDILLRLGAFIIIIVSVGIQMIYSFIWTEPLFLLFFSIHNLYLIKYVKENKLEYLIVMTIAALLLGLTRNAGIFLILPTFVLLLVQHAKKIVLPGFYLIFGLLGFTIWNINAIQYPAGVHVILDRIDIFANTYANVGNYLDVISNWFLPSVIPYFIRVAILVFLIVLMMKNLNKKNRFLMFQAISYIVTMIVFIKVDYSDVERLLALVYPLIIISIFTALDGNKNGPHQRKKTVIMIILAFWMVYISVRGVYNTYRWHQNRCLDYKSFKIEG